MAEKELHAKLIDVLNRLHKEEKQTVFLDALVNELRAERDKYKEALDRIGKQSLYDELEGQYKNGDFEYAYDCLIKVAREALQHPSSGKGGG